jgi:hypothetical protein
MYSSCATANPNGELTITTYGDGTGMAGQWIFGANTNLTLPSVNFDASPAPSSSPSIVFPSEGYIGASLGTASEKFLIKSEGKTWTFDGSYEDLTFPGGTVFSNQNIVVAANTGFTVTTFDGNSHFTTFGTDGSLTLPIGVSIDSSVSSLYPKIIADSDLLFSVQGQGANGSAALAWSLNPNTDTKYAAVGVNQGGGDSLAKVVLTAGNTTPELKVWKFDETGAFTFPDDSVQTVAYAGGVGREIMIDTNRTDSYEEVGSTDRPFKTFAAAIAAAETSADTAFTFVLMGCTITENVDFTGTTFTQITISTSSRSVISGNVTISNVSSLSQLFVRNIEVGGTFTLTGDGTSEQMNSCNFYNVSFSGAVNITATNATAFYGVSFFNVVNFTNLSYLYINGAQFIEDWTITANSTGVIPSRGINPNTGGSIAIVFSTIANHVYFVKGGTASYVFQPHMTRLGRTTGTYEIPAGWTVSAYAANFRGNWTNNGSLGMKISGTDNRVKGIAPSYSSIAGGDRVIADLAPTNSTGVEGDRSGMIAVGGGYLYVCTADWVSPGSANIWTRTALTAGAW